MMLWRRLVSLAAFLLCLYGISWAWIGPNSMDDKCAYQNNALWLSVDWTSTPLQPDDMTSLISRVQAHQVQYLYPYVTYLRADGTWSQSYEQAADFLAAYQSQEPETQILAWIGIPLQNNLPFGVQGWVHLQEVSTRQQIADFAGKMVELGFDGVHLNVESVHNDDAAFLSLLEEVRHAIGDNAMISIAGAHWVADPISHVPVVGDFGWQTSYYREVALRVNQIATMTYDSHMPTPALYRLWTREQVRGITASLDNLPVELLFGVSVSRESTPTHKPGAESLASGLTGICAGMTPRQKIEGNALSQQGVALYAAWEMTESDWAGFTGWH